jgi:hypothetical protein
VNLQLVVNILFAAEAGFVSNDITNFHNTHLRVVTIPTLLPLRKVIIPVDILGGQLLAPVILPNQVTGTVY